MRRTILAMHALLACAGANAANIVYTDTSGRINVAGNLDVYASCYSDSTDAVAGSLDALTDVVTSGAVDPVCGTDVGAMSDGNLSEITTEGFSISGTVSAYMQGSAVPQDALNDARMSRSVSFTLTEETELLLDIDWSGCVDCLGNMYMGSYFTLRESGGGTIDSVFFEFISPNFSGSPGGYNDAYVLAAGDYEIDMAINGQAYGANGSSGEYISFIGITVVPIPAAVWLFGSALFGLGWLRRRQIA